MPDKVRVVVLGAGPAGLGAAVCLARRGDFSVTVLEQNASVGGNAGSFELDGLRVDYGSHRLHPSCDSRILADIRSLLGDDLLVRPRHGRIYLRKRWVHFPLKPLNLAVSLPPSFMLGVGTDALLRTRSANGTPSFATELQKGLGKTICRDFYFPYAQKIWGCSPWDLDAEQARRRVSANSVGKMIRKVFAAVPDARGPMSGKFYYPRNGYGQISEAYCKEARAAGVGIHLGAAVSEVEVRQGDGLTVHARSSKQPQKFAAQLVLSTIPITRLVQACRPVPAENILSSASALKYRSMLLIYLVLDAERFSEYDAHYFPGSEVSITRLSEPKNYGLAELPGTTVLCAELPCCVNDHWWTAADDELKSIVLNDLSRAGLTVGAPVRRVVVRRLQHAYPIYTRDYREHFQLLDRWVESLDGVISLGRQGLFAHDNTHHTLAMAYAASDCISATGEFDRLRWKACRDQFESHVVED